jgi:hypothetical protein
VKGASMQAIWGQINYYTEEANKSLIKKLKKLTQTQQIKVDLASLTLQLQLDKSTNRKQVDGGSDDEVISLTSLQY